MSSPRELLLQKDFHLLSALVWAELYRFSHRREDSQIAQQSLAVLGADSSKPPGEQAFIDYIQGLLLIDVDRNSGRKMLRDAISKAGESADDLSIKARAYSFSALALDAGRVADFADVVELVAEALEVARPARPGRCAVAIAAQEGQSAIAVVDARGEISGQFVSSMASPEVDVSRLIPSTVIERLRACDRVVVLARAPVLGAARLFPPEIAWSYLLKGSGAQAVSRAAPRDHRVVVANPVPPPELKLPALAAYPEEPGDPAVLLLRGQAATPTRVLQAMRDASVIEFHTHGFVANDVSESSYLVLSPEADRQYAMTPGDISQVKLEASPLVILGACHAATSSRSLEGGIGLAEAFLRAGARSVIASPDAVQDLTANSFLAAIRERVARGADPAIAVRDERVRHLSVSPHDAWVFGVVVFE
jgi:hypothetical protein